MLLFRHLAQLNSIVVAIFVWDTNQVWGLSALVVHGVRRWKGMIPTVSYTVIHRPVTDKNQPGPKGIHLGDFLTQVMESGQAQFIAQISVVS